MKQIAKEFKDVFTNRGYKVKGVTVYANVDGKCEGLNTICVKAGVRTLSKISRDLSKIGFYDIRIEEEYDWGSVDFTDVNSEPKKVYFLKAFFKGEK